MNAIADNPRAVPEIPEGETMMTPLIPAILVVGGALTITVAVIYGERAGEIAFGFGIIAVILGIVVFLAAPIIDWWL